MCVLCSQRRGLTLNPITTLHYIAPASFAFLSIPWYFIEARALLSDNRVNQPARPLTLKPKNPLLHNVSWSPHVTSVMVAERAILRCLSWLRRAFF